MERESDPAPFRRTAAVVRNRGDVLDRADLEPGRLQRTDRGFPARARTLDEDVDLAHPMLLRAACGGSAAICAANGVDFRDPLNPTCPALAQEITAPVGSVMLTIVLLKVLLMCACPWTTFFFSLRRTLRPAP